MSNSSSSGPLGLAWLRSDVANKISDVANKIADEAKAWNDFKAKYPNKDLSKFGAQAGGVRTPITLHCGSSNFNMALKAEEFGRF